ncbi:MAG: hypothetical protein ACYDBX_01320 [Patescibacteria group bacterium]
MRDRNIISQLGLEDVMPENEKDNFVNDLSLLSFEDDQFSVMVIQQKDAKKVKPLTETEAMKFNAFLKKNF